MLLKVAAILFAGTVSFLITHNIVISVCLAFLGYLCVTKWVIFVIPRRFVSRLVGLLFQIKLGPLQVTATNMYIKVTNANTNDMVEPITHFKSLSQFFNRRIHLESRGLVMINKLYCLEKSEKNVIYAPADSVLSSYGMVQEKVTVKGLQYDVDELLSETIPNEKKAQLAYAVFYLSPGDYHDYHTPFVFQSEKVSHVGGDLWPVNNIFMGLVKGLLAKNERVVIKGTHDDRTAYVIPIGALNVGQIELYKEKLSQLTLNKPHITAEKYHACEPLGKFRLGSTVVVVIELKDGEKLEGLASGKVKIGQKCLQISSK